MSAPVNDGAPLLTPSESGVRSFRSRSQRFSRRAGLQGAARFIRRGNSRGMISEQSVRVREVASQQIEERQSDWAYSTPIVVLDLLWNTVFVLVTIVVLILSKDEATLVPLRLWLVGYGAQCLLHMVCVHVEYNRRRELNQVMYGGLSSAWSVGHVGSNPGSGLNSNLGFNRSGSSSSASDVDPAPFATERRVDENNTSVAKHLESANTMFSFIWWIMGFYWVSSAGETLADTAPKLYWLTITFLAFDVFFVVICVTLACIIGIAVCCCLPCIIALLYAVADQQDGATKEDIERLPRYNFRRIGEVEKKSGEIQESFGGIMTECDTDSPIEHVLSREDAECCICICEYEDGNELRELPCQHHFHSACIDKWLHMNATCPLCKYNIVKNGSQNCEDI